MARQACPESQTCRLRRLRPRRAEGSWPGDRLVLRASSRRYLRIAAENGAVRVLVVEGAPPLAQLLAAGLDEEGCQVDVAGRGDEALQMVRTTTYDVIVLDATLLDLSGVALCASMRNSGIGIPVLVLSARDAVEDRIAALEAGADDCLTKPFAFAELVARLHTLSRRGPLRRPPGR